MEALAEYGLVPADGNLWLDDSEAVGAVVTEEGAFVGWVDVAWPGPGEPVRRLNDVVHVPGRLARELPEALESTQARREAALLTRRFCGRRNTPGHMHSHDVCEASRRPGLESCTNAPPVATSQRGRDGAPAAARGRGAERATQA